MAGGLHRSRPRSINHTLWFVTAVAGWTVVIASSLAWNIHLEHTQVEALASNAAEAYFNKDKAIRLWGASHGGVYVPVDKRTPPNPHLVHIPERDITTPSGRKLTLMNPAYMLSQMMNDYSKLYGVKAKITSFPDKLLNPANMPDQWELGALKAFQRGASEAKEVVKVHGVPYLRLMRPLYIKQDCLKCHGASQGYKLGDLRGGVGVAVSMQPYWQAIKSSRIAVYSSHTLFWFTGLLLFSYLFIQARDREKERGRHERKLLRLNGILRELSYVDGLTNIPNRRAFNKALEGEWRRCKREKKSLSLIMVDIDLFKQYNDHFGHRNGDECLKQVARTLSDMARRQGDLLARYGGEEFVLLLPGASLIEAVAIAEKCRNSIVDDNIEFEASKVANVVSISLGVSSIVPRNGADPWSLLDGADKALYMAKENGRNRVESILL